MQNDHGWTGASLQHVLATLMDNPMSTSWLQWYKSERTISKLTSFDTNSPSKWNVSPGSSGVVLWLSWDISQINAEQSKTGFVRVVYSWVVEGWNSNWKMLKKTSLLRSQSWDNFPEAGTDLRHSHNHWWSHYNCCVPYLSTNMLQGSTCVSSALVLYHSLSVEAKCSLQMSGQKS